MKYYQRWLYQKNLDSKFLNKFIFDEKLYLKKNPDVKRERIVSNREDNICWLLDYDKLEIKFNRVSYEISLFSGNNDWMEFNFAREIQNPNEYLSFDLSGLNYNLINSFND